MKTKENHVYIATPPVPNEFVANPSSMEDHILPMEVRAEIFWHCPKIMLESGGTDPEDIRLGKKVKLLHCNLIFAIMYVVIRRKECVTNEHQSFSTTFTVLVGE